MQLPYLELRFYLLRVLCFGVLWLPISISTVYASDDLIVKPIQVAPHTYFVQGLPEMGSSKNQNFISNAGFVVTPKGVVVIDALGSPALAQKLINEISKISKQKIIAVVVPCVKSE